MMPLLLLFVSCGALFEVREVPLQNDSALVFLADVDQDNHGDICVLEGHTLRIVASASEISGRLTLPEGTVAFDFADVDGDGISNVIAVRGHDILDIDLVSGEEHLLFQLETHLSYEATRPVPRTLAVLRGRRVLLALPREDAFELRTLRGRLVESFPTANEEPSRLSQGAAPGWPRTKGAALAMRVGLSQPYAPTLPSELVVGSIQGPVWRRGTAEQAAAAASQRPACWPWFPLQPALESSPRVLYAYAPPDSTNTLLRLRTVEDDGAGAVRVGSPRRYPGNLVLLADDLPDFNGDGYTDALFWKSAAPVGSVDALARVAATGQWTVRLTAHLYDPAQTAYHPRPTGLITCQSAVGWHFDMRGGLPVRHLVLRDFNGNGHTDLACATDERHFAVWCFDPETGFSNEPDFELRTQAPINQVVFKTDLGGRGHTSIGLQTPKALYILRADDS